MSKRTRREFLEDALWTATIAATAGSARTLWAEPARPVGRVIGPNDMIRIAVIGVRGRGHDHVRGYSRMPDVTVAALCDCDLNVTAPVVKSLTGAGKPEPKVVQD